MNANSLSHNKEVKVSVKCMVYNHAPYLRKCLDGFVMQKTTFPFEVIVHDDASTDGSADIIKEYAERYPDIIKPILEKENMYSKNPKAMREIIYQELRGKYVAVCEGDDYWLDDKKLQKQVDILESTPDCVMVLTNGYRGADENREKWELINPFGKNRPSGLLLPEEVLLEVGGLVPTASMIVKRELYVDPRPEFLYPYRVGDRPMRMWSIINGSIYYISEPAVFYRRQSANSFTQRVKANKELAEKICSSFVDCLTSFNEYTGYKYDEAVRYMKGRQIHSYYANIGKPWKFISSKHFWDFYRMRPRPVYEMLVDYCYHGVCRAGIAKVVSVLKK